MAASPHTEMLPRESPLAIDYVSPLPPVRSGIADYSVDLLRAIEALERDRTQPSLDLRVVQVAGQDVDPQLAHWLDPVDFSQLGDEGRLPVYHMGNNPFHAAVYDAAFEHPGVVVLHDVFLHHLLQERTLAKTDVAGYVDQLERDHGWIGEAVAQPPRWSGYGRSGLFALPAHRTLLERQRGVVVHSEWARRFLEEEGISRPIRVIPMVMPVPDLTEELQDRSERLRASWGVEQGAFVLGSFGFQTPIKRTSTAIRALAQPGLEHVHLVVGGDATRGVDLEADASEAGVSDRVHLIGFLPSSDFAAAIRACDLTINLRYPTAGETSASLLRILALGRPALVSDYAQFRDVSEAFCVRVPLGDDPLDSDLSSPEVLELASKLQQLIKAPNIVSEMGRAARTFVASEHAPSVAGAAFVEALTQLAEYPKPITPTAVSEDPWAGTPTSLTWGRLESSLEVRGLDGWRPGERRTLELVFENKSAATFLAAARGEGGIMLEVQLMDIEGEGRIDLLSDQPWLGLPSDLEPGQVVRLRHQLRRPLGPTELRIEPHVVGGRGFSQCEGAIYEGTWN